MSNHVNPPRILGRTLIGLALSVSLVGCPGESQAPNHPNPGKGGGKSESVDAKPTNRIDVPATVRTNLGITFIKVENRPVSQTLRVPGRFERTQTARRDYQARVSGRVTMLVQQYQSIEIGLPLYRLEIPEWQLTRQQLVELELAIGVADAELPVLRAKRVAATRAAEVAMKRLEALPAMVTAIRSHKAGLDNLLAVWTAREAELTKLAQAGAGLSQAQAEARAALADVSTRLREVEEELAQQDLAAADIRLDAELEKVKVPEIDAEIALATQHAIVARAKLESALTTAAGNLGVGRDWLISPTGATKTPVWQDLTSLEFVAERKGVVQALAVTDGAWVSAGETVLHTFDPMQLRFRGVAMQADLARLRDGLAARIVSPLDSHQSEADSLKATISLGLDADADERTLDLLAVPEGMASGWPAWIRPGVAAQLEVTLNGAEPVLAIPERCVIADGLERIFFRRDPKNPDKVIRVAGDFGVRDGRWISLNSGVAAGDEVVLDGVYQLKLTGSGKASGAGHFHADGTFHEGSH